MTPKDLRKLRRDVEERIDSWEQDLARRFNLTREPDVSFLFQGLREKGWNVDPETAVCANLAVVGLVGGHRWPPPPELISALLSAFGRPEHQDPRGAEQHLLRAPEFVVAFLAGWLRRTGSSTGQESHHPTGFPLDPTSGGWLGVAGGAHEILRRFVGERVSSCLNHLAQGNRKGGVPGFPTQDHRSWTLEALHTFLAPLRRCNCWRNVAPGAERAALKGNARAKAGSCLEKHNVDRWRPARRTERSRQVETLWYFVERAVKGFVGPFKHEGFPAGMLHSALWRRGYRLTRANVARRFCPLCEWTVRMRCEHGPFRPAEEPLESKNWLILMSVKGQPVGGFERGSFVTCADGHLYPKVLPYCQYGGCGRRPAATARPQTCYFMT